jgi:hypothetical protein
MVVIGNIICDKNPHSGHGLSLSGDINAEVMWAKRLLKNNIIKHLIVLQVTYHVP